MATADEKAPHVELGYVAEECDPTLLHSAYFPSKIGGRPSWLHLSSLPTPESLLCKNCSKPTILLLQVYAPLEEKPSCFHRTLFLFVCRDPACSKTDDSSNFLAFRSQLPRTNPFYSFDPPDYDTKKVDVTKFHNASEYQSLCVVCGCSGTKNCSGCRKRNFCSKEHQKVDWTLGAHKGACKSASESSYKSSNEAFLFPEQQIDTEPDPDEGCNSADEDEEQGDVDEKEEMEKVKKFQGDLPDPELEAMANKETSEIKAFTNFKKKIESAPDQIMRYSRGGEPVWISESALPLVPPCEVCRSPRKFEFQIMPQLLTHLDVDDVGKSIDWGVISVFTCEESCDISPEGSQIRESAYRQEFVVKQDVSQ